MPASLPSRPSARFLLGLAPGESWGYQRPVSVYVRVELRRQSSFGTDPREQETTDHRTVVDPIELSVVCDIHGPSGTDIGGGTLDMEQVGDVDQRKQPDATFEAIARLIPWHMNALRAGCDHQTIEYETDPYGRTVPSLDRTPPCPVTGYRYGHAWLVRELPPEIIADAVALGAVVPPAATPPVLTIEAE